MHSQHHFNFCPRCGARLLPELPSGEKHLACQACGWILYEDPKVACGAILLSGNKVLLVQRVMEPHIGAWSIPAGFMNAHELPEDTVRREVLEETGLVVEVENLVNLYSGREHPRGSDILLVYLVKQVGGELSAGDDAGDAAWFQLEKLPPLAFESTRMILAAAMEHHV